MYVLIIFSEGLRLIPVLLCVKSIYNLRFRIKGIWVITYLRETIEFCPQNYNDLCTSTSSTLMNNWSQNSRNGVTSLNTIPRLSLLLSHPLSSLSYTYYSFKIPSCHPQPISGASHRS